MEKRSFIIQKRSWKYSVLSIRREYRSTISTTSKRAQHIPEGRNSEVRDSRWNHNHTRQNMMIPAVSHNNIVLCHDLVSSKARHRNHRPLLASYHTTSPSKRIHTTSSSLPQQEEEEILQNPTYIYIYICAYIIDHNLVAMMMCFSPSSSPPRKV
jgi:hypothetical protein